MKAIFINLVQIAKAPLHQKIIGLVASLFTALIMDITAIILTLWFLVTIDVYFAIKKGNKDAGKRTHILSYDFWASIKSIKLQHTIDKGASYLIVLVCVWVLDRFILDIDVFEFIGYDVSVLEITGGVLAFKELWSVGEKFSFLYGFNPVEKVFNIFKNKEFNG